MNKKLNDLIKYAMKIDEGIAIDIKNAVEESFSNEDSNINDEFIMINAEEMQGMVDEDKVIPDYEIKSFVFEK